VAVVSVDEGPLLAADEYFGHQIVETQAYVAQADRSWTEKVCAQAAAKDGSLQVHFGVGKYTNRNVFDGYATVSRGREQWVVRASRRLSGEPDRLGVGPIDYDIVTPLEQIRFSLAPSDAAPISFEWTFAAAVPPVLELRDRQHVRRGYRLESDLLRYHQLGAASGWVEINGDRTEITPADWFSTRDRSWGVRHDVGTPPTDIEGAGRPRSIPGMAWRFSWSPMLFEREDGSRYAIHHQFRETRAFGYSEQRMEATVEQPDGTVEHAVAVSTDLQHDPVNRRVLGGTVTLTMADGTVRPITVRAHETGAHLGLGLYMGLDGHHHGEFRGKQHLEGEYVADCTQLEVAQRVHQIRDAVIAVTDPVGGGTGWGNMQTTVAGGWPELGLDEDTSFV
jgi:hypothetical protein